MFFAPRSIQTDLQNTCLSAFLVQIFDHFLTALRTSSHENDNVLSLRISIVFEQRKRSSCKFTDFFHCVFNDVWGIVVELLSSNSLLEENIGSLACSSRNWIDWAQSLVSKVFLAILLGEKLSHFSVVHQLNVLVWMTSLPSIKEMQKGQTCSKSSNMRNQCHVVYLLTVGTAENSESYLSNRHNIRVIVEDTESMLWNRSWSDMNNCGSQFSSH